MIKMSPNLEKILDDAVRLVQLASHNPKENEIHRRMEAKFAQLGHMGYQVQIRPVGIKRYHMYLAGHGEVIGPREIYLLDRNHINW